MALKNVPLDRDEFTSFIMKRVQRPFRHPRLYWEWWPKPVFTPGSINWLTEISAIAGGCNEFRDVELASVQTDWEDVLQRNPDYILLAWVGVRPEKVKKEVVLKRPGWKELEAIETDDFRLWKKNCIAALPHVS